MGFFDRIIRAYDKLNQAKQDVIDLTVNLPAKIKENFQLFSNIINTDWLNKTNEEREESVESVKKRVIHDLIPVAGQLSVFGVPGILLYGEHPLLEDIQVLGEYNNR